MGLKDLPVHEMVKVTSSWVKKGHRDREILSRHPSIAVLLPEVDGAHYELVYSQPEEWITGQLDEADMPSSAPREVTHPVSGARPSDLLRGIWYRCLAEEHITAYPEVKSALRALRTALLPGWLDSGGSDEIGSADIAGARRAIAEISIKERQLLSRLGTLQGTLWDSVQEYVSLVDRQGRRTHSRSGTRDDSELSSSQITGPRERWIRVVNRVRTVASVLVAGDPELKALIQRVRQIEGNAEHRGPTWKNTASPQPV